jgi:hypothetical protein
LPFIHMISLVLDHSYGCSDRDTAVNFSALSRVALAGSFQSQWRVDVIPCKVLPSYQTTFSNPDLRVGFRLWAFAFTPEEAKRELGRRLSC